MAEQSTGVQAVPCRFASRGASAIGPGQREEVLSGEGVSRTEKWMHATQDTAAAILFILGAMVSFLNWATLISTSRSSLFHTSVSFVSSARDA